MGGNRVPLVDGYVDLDECVVVRGAMTTPLSPTEAKLIAYLSERGGQCVSPDQLVADVWGYRSTVSIKAVGQLIFRLRRKIEVHPEEPMHLVTRTARGFSWSSRSPEEEMPGIIGRLSERAVLERALAAGRLVSLVGPGGVGKTTLGRAIAASRGATRIELDARTASGGLANVVRETLGIELDRSVGAVLREKGTHLLILDNLELALDAARQELPEWLSLAPELRVLCLSRQRLEQRDEIVVPLDWMNEEDSKAFLRDRLQRLGVWNDLEPAVVDQLVRSLGGWPLAMEIAAGRARVVSPDELLRRLDELLRWAGPWRDVPERHRSMYATLSWSWELATASQRTALQTLATAFGGFEEAEAERVLGGEIDVASDLVRFIEEGWLTRARTAFRFHPLVLEFIQKTEGYGAVAPGAAERWLDVMVRDSAVDSDKPIEQIRRVLSFCQQTRGHRVAVEWLETDSVRRRAFFVGAADAWLDAIERNGNKEQVVLARSHHILWVASQSDGPPKLEGFDVSWSDGLPPHVAAMFCINALRAGAGLHGNEGKSYVERWTSRFERALDKVTGPESVDLRTRYSSFRSLLATEQLDVEACRQFVVGDERPLDPNSPRAWVWFDEHINLATLEGDAPTARRRVAEYLGAAREARLLPLELLAAAYGYWAALALQDGELFDIAETVQIPDTYVTNRATATSLRSAASVVLDRSVGRPRTDLDGACARDRAAFAWAEAMIALRATGETRALEGVLERGSLEPFLHVLGLVELADRCTPESAMVRERARAMASRLPARHPTRMAVERRTV